MRLHADALLIKNEYRVLALMLFTLLLAISPGQSALFAKSLLLAHFGLFLLWQPVFKQQQSFNLPGLVILLLSVSAFVAAFNPWLNAFWVLALLSLLTGRIFNRGFERAVYGFAVIILFLYLVLILTPQLFGLRGLPTAFQHPLERFIQYSPLLLLLAPARQQSAQQVDFIRGFLLAVLIIFLCMGTALVAFTTGQSYLASLLASISLLSVFLVFISLLWAPPGGMAGLASLWEKYLLNIGGPFEQWINHIASAETRRSQTPEAFLDASLQYLMQQPWVCGVYRQRLHKGERVEEKLDGEKSRHVIGHQDDHVSIRIYSHAPPGPALSLHARLMLRVLFFYYRAKRQEQQILKQAHLQAIYETGSKLTHDVKNILQSAQTLTRIIEHGEADDADMIDMLRRQLPLLGQRLQTTLNKLKNPDTGHAEAANEPGERIALSAWWQGLQTRYRHSNIAFVTRVRDGEAMQAISVPAEVFDSVAENLIENARNKAGRESGIEIQVSLDATPDSCRLSVCDTGTAIPADKQNQLFHQAVDSQDGYGIGLYQCHQLAQRHGWRLSLDANENGRVCFVLAEDTGG